MRILIAATLALGASTALAQCPLGVCPRVPSAHYGAVTPLTTATPEPCGKIETVAPCEPVKSCTENISKEVDECVACPIRSTITAPLRVVANLLDSANRTRTRYGLPVFTYDATLEAGAKTQAQYCARVGRLQHGAGAIEILAYNSQGLEAAINQWLASPAHRAILLNGRYRYAGVAVVRDSYGRSWCAMRFR